MEKEKQQQQQPETWEQMRPRFLTAIAVGLLVIVWIWWCIKYLDPGITLEAQKEPAPETTNCVTEILPPEEEIVFPAEGILLPAGHKYYRTALSVLSDTGAYEFKQDIVVLPDGYALIKNAEIIEFRYTPGQAFTQMPVLSEDQEIVYHIFEVQTGRDCGWTSMALKWGD